MFKTIALKAAIPSVIIFPDFRAARSLLAEPIQLSKLIRVRLRLPITHQKGITMGDSKKEGQAKREDWPVENPKKLPADFPKKFDTEQKANSRNKRRGKGAILHGSM